MTQKKQPSERYIQLTEQGRDRLKTAYRRSNLTIQTIAYRLGRSPNTVGRALKPLPVFLSTHDEVWKFLQSRLKERGEEFPDSREGVDFVWVESGSEVKPGWMSRQTPRYNPVFTGRRDVLDALDRALQSGESAALVPEPQALTGLGGVGKTQTAIAYAHEQRHRYRGVFWINAETLKDFHAGLADIARELQLLNAAHATQEQAAQAARDWFGKESGWLLALDNVEDMETLAASLPPTHNGSLLLTTRAINTLRWAAPIEIRKFDPEEGALLLLRRAGELEKRRTLADAPVETRQAALELSVEVDGLPLALDQAGAYLRRTGTTAPEYLALYRERGLHLLDECADSDHKSVTITFLLALQRMEEQDRYGRAAAEMTRLCAFLAPDAIPEAIFASYCFAQDDLRSPLTTLDYLRVRAAACAYSLMKREAKTETLSMHRLVQEVIRQSLPPQERPVWARRALHAVAEATPDFEFGDCPLCPLLLPHWRRCIEFIEEEGVENAQAAHVLNEAGRFQRVRAQYAEAETWLRRAAEMAAGVYGEEHLKPATYLDDLAQLYRELGRYEEAASLFERGLEITAKAMGPEHPNVADTLHNLALLYVNLANYPQAEDLFLRALAIREKEPEPENPTTAATLNQLAGVYRCQRRYAEAEPLYARALAIYERTLGPEHLSTGICYNNIASLTINQERYEEAERLLRRALEINEKARGPEHPETGIILWNLALVQWKRAKMAEAETLFQRSHALLEKSWGKRHDRVRALLSQYADFLEDAGRAEQAAQMRAELTDDTQRAIS